MSEFGLLEAASGRELSLVLDAYFDYRVEVDGKRPIRNMEYYKAAEQWCLEQGVDIDLWRQSGVEGIIWENEGRKVEFYLKWVK